MAVPILHMHILAATCMQLLCLIVEPLKSGHLVHTCMGWVLCGLGAGAVFCIVILCKVKVLDLIKSVICMVTARVYGLNIFQYMPVSLTSFIYTQYIHTIIWKIFSVELFSFCAIIDEIKSHEFFSTMDN